LGDRPGGCGLGVDSRLLKGTRGFRISCGFVCRVHDKIAIGPLVLVRMLPIAQQEGVCPTSHDHRGHRRKSHAVLHRVGWWRSVLEAHADAAFHSVAIPRRDRVIWSRPSMPAVVRRFTRTGVSSPRLAPAPRSRRIERPIAFGLRRFAVIGLVSIAHIVFPPQKRTPSCQENRQFPWSAYGQAPQRPYGTIADCWAEVNSSSACVHLLAPFRNPDRSTTAWRNK
jgi:hypothetical protein